MNGKLIHRMIESGFSDSDINIRIRCGLEIVAAIREQIRLEAVKKVEYKSEESYDWDEE